MSNNWQIKKLGALCTFVRGPFGGSLKKNIFKKEGYAVYEQQHAINNQFVDIRYFIDKKKFNEMRRFELKPGDLIMSCSGTMGKIAIAPEKIDVGIINQALLKLTPNENLDVNFLKYWMESPNFQNSIKKYSKGAAIKNIVSVKILKQIEITLPPLPEQRRIVKVLDEAFEKLEIAKKNTEKNLANAKELFENKKSEIFIELEKYHKIWPIFSTCKDYYAGGDKPKVHFSKTKTEKYTIPVISNGEKNDGFFGYTNTARSKEPSITISARGTIGYTVYRDYPFFPIVRLVVLTPNLNVINPEYLMYAIKNLDILKSGSSIPQLTVPMMKNYSIPVPEIDEQAEIVSLLKTLENKTIKYKHLLNKKAAIIDELQKSLLQKAFSGEL